MRTLGNLFWFIFGGIIMGLCWCFFGLVAFLSIVGIPWGRACFVIAGFSFLPFGKEAIARDELTLREDIGTGGMGMLGNIIWFVVAGFWLAIGHLFSAIACAITIIGIPFAWQHIKLAELSIFPVGKTVVTKDIAAAARSKNAQAEVDNIRERVF